MPEGRNTNRRPLIFLAIALFVAAAAGLAAVYFASQATRAPVVAAAAVVEPDAVIVSSDDAEGNVVQGDDTEAPKNYTRIDDGSLVLIKQKSADASLEEVINLFEDDAPVILATCYSVEACLQARLIMAPLAKDDVVQETFYTVIIERFDANVPAKRGQDGISYMFAVPKCGIESGASAYTSTGLLEAAVSSYRNLTKICKDNQ